VYLSGAPQPTPIAGPGSRVQTIGVGDAGTFATLGEMARLANAANAGQLDTLTVLTARNIVSACDGRNLLCQATALRRWLAGHFRFVRDPVDVEGLWDVHDALDLVRRQGFVQGDCDEAAVLAAALGKAVGFPAMFTVLGFDGEPEFRHTFASLLTPGGWLEFDITRPYQRLPPVTRVAEFPV
jgi:transglutaminase-like putative cysteine protease